MNLLRLSLAFILAVFLSLLITPQATAVDHPWDDLTVDTSKTTGVAPQSGDQGGVQPKNPPVIRRVFSWLNRFYEDLRHWIVGNASQTRTTGDAIVDKQLDVKHQATGRVIRRVK